MPKRAAADATIDDRLYKFWSNHYSNRVASWQKYSAFRAWAIRNDYKINSWISIKNIKKPIGPHNCIVKHASETMEAVADRFDTACEDLWKALNLEDPRKGDRHTGEGRES